MSHSAARRLVLLLGSIAVLTPAATHACSICRCGDPTFNALGPAGYTTTGLRAAVDWERFDKDEGSAAEESESQVENRVTTFLSYGINERFTVSARVPYSSRKLTASADGEDPEVIHTHGLSDPEIYGQALLWSSSMTGMGVRTTLGLTAGVKAPWGENDATSDGERVDEHAQPGTGSTDVFGSITLLHLLDLRSSLFASVGYRHTGGNDHDYRYGSTFLANASYEHKLGRAIDGVLELNFRQAAKDRVDADGTLSDDTGGSLLYVSPKVLVSVGQGVVFRVGAQIPTVGSLNGEQTERAVVDAGITVVG